MVTTYTHTLTPTEEACGVTLEAVAAELPRGAFRWFEGQSVFVVDPDIAPALALSVARCAFGGSAVESIGRTLLGRAYRAVSA